MKIISTLKKTILGGAITAALLGFSSGTLQAKTDLTNLTNELEIMSNIMRTALAQSSNESSYKIRTLDVIYLSNQGVVFEVNASSGGHQFVFKFSQDNDFISVPPVPPMPPVTGDGHDFEIEFHSDEREGEREQIMEQAHEAMEDARNQLRELRDQERDYGWEMRDAKRKLRDIEFELRSADKARSDELRKEKRQLDQGLAKLKSQQGEAEAQANKLQQQQEQQAAKKREMQQQQHAAFLTQFETNVSATLCKYGNGLAALSEDENVSFILPNFAAASRSNKQDRIYVFANKDIQSCVKNKLSAKQLLAKADSYNF